MKIQDWLRLAAQNHIKTLPDGKALRLLTSRELLEAKREAASLAANGKETAVCSNACILARAVLKKGQQLYHSGSEVLSLCTPEQIENLTKQWAAFNREENPGLATNGVRLDQLKKSLDTSKQRLQWRVLRSFGALPTEKRVKAMTDADYLFCAVNRLLDEEERLQTMCPSCRAKAETPHCPVCGRETGELLAEENKSFDWKLYQKRREGL